MVKLNSNQLKKGKEKDRRRLPPANVDVQLLAAFEDKLTQLAVVAKYSKAQCTFKYMIS